MGFKTYEESSEHKLSNHEEEGEEKTLQLKDILISKAIDSTIQGMKQDASKQQLEGPTDFDQVLSNINQGDLSKRRVFDGEEDEYAEDILD